MDYQRNFHHFISRQLMLAGIGYDYIPNFMTPDNMKLFEKAFTHPSYDENNNYEILEFTGDGILKGILTIYIPQRFPDLTTSEGKLSKIRRSLEMSKTLSGIALKLGFWNFVRGDEETMNKKRNKTLEDVYEAFIGALYLAVDNVAGKGIGFSYAQRFVEFSLNQLTIDTSSEQLDDPITILNELYKKTDASKGKVLGWNMFPQYTFEHIILPNFDFLNPKQHPQGTMYFDKKTKQVMVKHNDKFIPFKNLKYPIKLLMPNTTQEQLIANPDNFTKINLSRVYGKPISDITTFFLEDNVSADIIPNDNNDQIVVGQGTALQRKDAKKMAAKNAYDLFKQLGYKR